MSDNTMTIRGITARIPEGCPYFIHCDSAPYFAPTMGERWPVGDPIAACVAEHWWNREARKYCGEGYSRPPKEHVVALDQAELWHRIAEGESDEKA